MHEVFFEFFLRYCLISQSLLPLVWMPIPFRIVERDDKRALDSECWQVQQASTAQRAQYRLAAGTAARQASIASFKIFK